MKILILKNKKEVAEKVSGMIAKEIKDNPRIVLGLPTGQTMILLYKKLSLLIKKNKIDLSKIKTFNIDEYTALSESDKNSYHYYMNNLFFKNVNLVLENTHFPSKLNYKQYDFLIKKSGGLDLTILGIGVNGHIAFNEPGSSIRSKTRIVKLTRSTINSNSRFFKNQKNNVPPHLKRCGLIGTCFLDAREIFYGFLCTENCKRKQFSCARERPHLKRCGFQRSRHKKTPKKAVTIGISTILSSKKIILIATGKNKAEIIAKTLKAKPSSKIPATFLKRHNDIQFILDKEASSFLHNKL